MADKADPSWFQEGDAEVTLGEASGEESAADADSGDGGSGSTGGTQYTIDAGDSDIEDGHGKIDTAGRSNRDSDGGPTTGRATPPTPADPQRGTGSAYTVAGANRSPLSLPDSITRMGRRLYHLASDL